MQLVMTGALPTLRMPNPLLPAIVQLMNVGLLEVKLRMPCAERRRVTVEQAVDHLGYKSRSSC